MTCVSEIPPRSAIKRRGTALVLVTFRPRLGLVRLELRHWPPEEGRWRRSGSVGHQGRRRASRMAGQERGEGSRLCVAHSPLADSSCRNWTAAAAVAVAAGGFRSIHDRNIGRRRVGQFVVVFRAEVIVLHILLLVLCTPIMRWCSSANPVHHAVVMESSTLCLRSM